MPSLRSTRSSSVRLTQSSVSTRSSQKKSSLPLKSSGCPKHWEEVHERIRVWRLNNEAPVDTIGCERLGDQDKGDTVFRFQTLVALMLSSQTRDEMTALAMSQLKKATGNLTAFSLDKLSKEQLTSCISKVSFANRKTEYIQKTVKVLIEKYNGDIPKTIEELTALPGVGNKMGFLALNSAWGRNDGIGVDVHVHRISNRLGWVKTKEPDATRLALESWLPKDKWFDINLLLVGFGQKQCRAIKPNCQACPVGKGLCPSFKLKW
ncbi:DNA N-glycosylase and apurinic/apyrimidinic (AP) lyase [Coelomomyces lativittatus]|nr:DNA N-glycosylase and apurinic/apyrimidinic (AP) lyase [Coelomomyces lativittatus]KAJ1515686.1 DNA N-glycosylase and apurinic/apyrimidinic (AP) lyase [Coelomomyces lativittatus]KAJ1517570.1 DNA N-glycosylase and apurinic/apyrimidinic (AP) lyase [Coelomomyces lativittatus]